MSEPIDKDPPVHDPTAPFMQSEAKLDCPQPPIPLSLLRATSIVAICTTAMVINVAGGLTITLSLHTLGRDLNIPESRQQWLISSFSLTSGCFLLLFGRLADLYGRRLVFLCGMLWFALWSLAAGFGRNEISMDIFRALQGMGPAAFVPAALGILAHSFPPSRARTIAFATFSAGAPCGGAFGNVLGGLLTEFSPIHCRAIFFVFAGISTLSALGALLVIDADIRDPSADRRVDWIGAMLVTTGLVLFTFVLGEGESAPQQWRTPYILVSLILSIFLVASFVYWEDWLVKRTGRQPLMRLDLFTRSHGQFAVMQGVAFLGWSGFSSYIFYVIAAHAVSALYSLPQVMIRDSYLSYQGLTPVLTMIRLLPMMVTGLTCNLVVSFTVGRISGLLLVAIGTLFTGVGALLFAVIIPSKPYWAFGFPSTILSVFGADFVFATGSLFVAKVALPHEQSLAGGLFNTLTNLGTAFGLALTNVVYDRTVARESKRLGIPVDKSNDGAPPTALLKGYRAAQWMNFGFLMLALLFALVFLRDIGIVGHDETRKGKQHQADLEGKDPDDSTLTERVDDLPSDEKINITEVIVQ